MAFTNFANLIQQAFPYIKNPSQVEGLAQVLANTQIPGQGVTYLQLFNNTMSGYSAHVNGAANVYYSGNEINSVGEYISAGKLANAFAESSGGQYATIDMTPLGMQISNLEEQGAFNSAEPVISQFFADNNIVNASNYNPADSLENAFWRGGSEQFASQAVGEGVLVGPSPGPNSAYVQNEIPNISTGVAQNVVDPDNLFYNQTTDTYDYRSTAPAGDISVSDVLSSSPNIDPTLAAEANAIPSSAITVDATGGEFPSTPASALGDTLGVVGETAGALGEALVIADVINSTSKAINQLGNGDASGAALTERPRWRPA